MRFPGVRLVLLGLLVVVGGGYIGWKYLSERHAPEGYLPSLPATTHSVAVLPFTVDDPSWRSMGDGIAHLLSARLGGNGNLRRINPHAILSQVQPAAPVELNAATATTATRALGGQAFVLGRLTIDGDNVRLSARWYEIGGNGEGDDWTVEGNSAQLTDLIDKLGERLTQGRVAADDVRIARVAAVTTQSPKALRSYFDGEAALADGRYADALSSLNAAVNEDLQFALAFYRLAQVARWAGQPEVADAARQQALLLSNRLPIQERLLLDIELSAMRGEQESAAERYRALLAVAPDEWEAWLQLSEIDPDAASRRQSFEKAAALLPRQPALRSPRNLTP